MTASRAPARRQMNLSLFAGHYHVAGWRHPDAADGWSDDIGPWVTLVQKLEKARFDMLFLADSAALTFFDRPEVFERSPYGTGIEPLMLASALAPFTKHLGLATTVATSYKAPYDVARQIASLDLVSRGRAAWNVVTGVDSGDAEQYGDAAQDRRNERYARGEEFVDVVTALWASVGPDAFPRNKETGIYADPSKVHRIDHHGKYYSVAGPLKVSPSPQGRPVLFQAGQSHDGREFAARIAEVIFTAWSEFDMASAFYRDMKSRVASKGRNPDHVKIMPGLRVTVGRTAAEAEEKEAYLDSLLDMKLAMARAVMGIADGTRGIDLSNYSLDAPFPDLPKELTTALSGRSENHLEMARRHNLTLRDVLVRSSNNNMHFTIKGTPTQIVDQMQHWFENGACDGFNMMCAYHPGSLDDVIELVLPELQRRGLFRTEYEGTTLRENLCIPVEPIPPQTVGVAEVA